MKIRVVDSVVIGDFDIDKFRKLGEVEVYGKTSYEELKERIKDTDIIITNKAKITREILEHANKLKLICITATGTDNIDMAACKEKGVEVKNAVGYSTDSVSEHTFALLFTTMKEIGYLNDYVKSGEYTKSGSPTNVTIPFYELAGKEWGIVGLGNIGKRVAGIATLFGAKVSYASVSGGSRKEEYQEKSLEELLKTSDIISIHSPLNDKTRNLFDESKLKLMKEGATLINVGRGNIVDEKALARFVDEKNLKVGLDVMSQEPIEADNPLLKVKNKYNVVITPHTAWGTVESRARLMDIVYKNIEGFLGK